MTAWLSAIRDCCWSDLCSVDGPAYQRYLDTVQSVIDHGVRVVAVGGGHGTGDGSKRCGCGIDNDVRFIVEGRGGGVVEENPLVCGVADSSGTLDAQDNGDCGSGSKRSGVAGCGLSSGSADDGVSGLFCLGGSATVQCAPGRESSDSQFDAGSVGRRPCEAVLTPVGKWSKRNRAKRERKKQQEPTALEAVPEWRRKSPVASVHAGVFSSCAVEVQHELRDTRALMLIAKNKLEAEKAAASLRKAESVRKARTDEMEFEMNRLKLEDERRKMIEKRLSELPHGYAETLASAGITSDIPSLSSGSVSPNSSISMAEFHEMQKQVADLKEQIAFDAAEFTEAKVKLMSQLSMKTEENEKLKKEPHVGARNRSDVRVVIPDGEFDVIQSEADVTFDDGFHGRGSAVIRQELKKLRIHEGNGLSSWSF